jgi:pimeloyl-ACP methyl ester carboxylesterase
MAPQPLGPRFLYLHGFASGPDSPKGLAFARCLGDRGLVVERLNLRVPSLERLRLSAAIAVTIAAMGGERDRVVLLGSSLGGLTAARVAERDPRVCALVLLAPAFQAAKGWRSRLAGEPLRRWRETGWLEVDDYATKQRARVDYGFLEDLDAMDPADSWPDVRVPTLIVHGRQDAVVDIDGSRAFAVDRRNVRLVEVDDGHPLVATLPSTVLAVERFLSPFVNGPDL